MSCSWSRTLSGQVTGPGISQTGVFQFVQEFLDEMERRQMFFHA